MRSAKTARMEVLSSRITLVLGTRWVGVLIVSATRRRCVRVCTYMRNFHQVGDFLAREKTSQAVSYRRNLCCFSSVYLFSHCHLSRQTMFLFATVQRRATRTLPLFQKIEARETPTENTSKGFVGEARIQANCGRGTR